MCLGMGGSGVPMRPAEVLDRVGKQPDGSAKTREAKVVSVWTAESRDEAGKPVSDPGSITYSAAIERAAVVDTSRKRSDLPERVLREAKRRGFTEAPRCAVLGDGSSWIWNTAAELFPQAIQILNRHHAKEGLHRTAQSIFGATSAVAKPCPRPAVLNWTMETCRPSSARSDPISEPATKRQHVRRTSSATAVACAIRSSRRRFVYFHRRPGGRMQNGDRHAPGTRRHALERLRCQCHHRSSLCQAQWRFEDFWERRTQQLAAAA